MGLIETSKERGQYFNYALRVLALTDERRKFAPQFLLGVVVASIGRNTGLAVVDQSLFGRVAKENVSD
jgi:hypothetical protein